MTGNAQWHERLDKLRSLCDRSLDSATGLESFLIDVLRHALQVEGLTAAAVYQFTSPEPTVLVQEGLAKLSRDGLFILDPDHVSLLRDAIQRQKLQVVQDRSVPEAGLREHTLLMLPLPGQQPPFRVIELATVERLHADQLAHLREVLQLLVTYAMQYQQEGTRTVTPQDEGSFWDRFDQFLLRLQRSLSVKETVAVAANDGRSLIGCDRVSIALRHGSGAKVYAVSGQEDVAQRANLVRMMAALAREVIRGGQPVTYRGTTEGLAPQIEKPLADYLAESRTRMVLMLPLREPEDLIVEHQPETVRRQERPRKVIGCLIVEQATEARPKPQVVQRAELLVEHIEVAVHNAQRYESIFLLPLWRLIGRFFAWFKGRRVWAAVGIVVALAAVGAGLAYIPWDYRVEAKGQLMPVIQHEVFAPWDGDVIEVFVKSGERVVPGQPLVKLQSDELEAERVRLEADVQEKQKYLLQVGVQAREADRRKSEEVKRLQFEEKKAQVELEGARSRLAVVQERIKKLLVTAPAAGVVATFQVEQLLLNRPVRRGELLLQVMDETGDWRLELKVPEYRHGHVERAMSQAPQRNLPIEFVLATAVEKSYPAELIRLANRTDQEQETGTVVEVHAKIDKDLLPSRNIGADVIAKINCGRKNLFYVLFGDVVEFVQRYFWL
jgi:multidrug efflux pump subunit AcrA (membrane-fusion protein)